MPSLAQQSPAQVLARTIRVATINGWSVIAFSLIGAALSVAGGDHVGSVVCGLIAIAGAVEVRGARMLTQGDGNGSLLLVGSQMAVLTIVLGYVVGAFLSVGPGHVVGRLPGSAVRTLVNSAGMSPREALAYLAILLRVTYAVTGVGALVYQGGMAIYYRRRAEVIEQALQSQPQTG